MERETLFADVIVPLGVPNKYTYRVPAEWNEKVEPGMRVLVQFGKKRFYTGIVRNVHREAPSAYTAKYIESLLDDKPVADERMLRFWDWMSFYYYCNPGDVMNAALPSGLKLSSTSHIQLSSTFDLELSDHNDFTPKEHLVLDALLVTPVLSMDDIAKIADVSSPAPLVNRLAKKGAIEVYEEVRDKFRPKLESFVRLSGQYHAEAAIHEILDKLEKRAFRQAEALMAFLAAQKGNGGGEWVARKDLARKVEVASVMALVKKGVLEEEQFETGRLVFSKRHGAGRRLNANQEQAIARVREGLSAGKPVLLHGVTGSGKTEIYIKLIEEALGKGKQVLYLVPEIALTSQLITRLRFVFGEKVGLYHSRFSENERVEVWRNVMGQDSHGAPAGPDTPRYEVVMGARSSLFLPFTNLGLIIVDEEHDTSFKQHDPAPRYNARDSAVYLAHLHEADIVLGSATPSLDSHYNVLHGKYAFARLAERHEPGAGTHVHLCDTRRYEERGQMRSVLTEPLREAIEKAITSKKQIILFHNRRGFAPYTECRQCGYVPQCVQCDVSLIYHKQSHRLTCHYCGYNAQPPAACPACGSNSLHYKGLGTEKAEEDLQLLFPKARIARMDLDSTRSKHAHSQLIEEFSEGIIDILIGTQMVTKGLDFGNVSVVGVLNADSLLNFPDFRAFERAYQLLMQVRGRAGRKEHGAVYIQTSRPDHPVIMHVLQDTELQFYSDCMAERKQYFYPPFARLLEVTLMSRDLDEVNHISDQLFAELKRSFGTNLLGPEFPLVSRIRNFYHKRIIIKVARSENQVRIRTILSAAIAQLHDMNGKAQFRINVNVDPL